MIDRRSLLAAGVATAGLAAFPARLAAAAAAPAAPVARVAPVTDDYYGARVIDTYRWMENPQDRDWLPFLRGQNAHARAVLDAIPGRAALARRIAALSGDTVATRRVSAAGDLLFYEQRPAGADNFKLFVRDVNGAPRQLIDPTTLRGEQGRHISLDWWEPSFDGRFLAYGLSQSGSEASVLHIMEVRSGEVLPERIAMADNANPAWLPDASGFFYNQLTGQRGTPSLYQNSVAKLHRLRTDPRQDPIVMRRGLDPAVAIEPIQFPVIATTEGSPYAIGLVIDIRTEISFHVTPLEALAAGRPRWRKVADFGDLVTGFALLGDELYMLVNKDTVRGRIVRTPIAAPDLATATLVVPQGPTVLESLAASKDAVFVTIMDSGVQRLDRIGRDGKAAPVALPFEGAINGVYASSSKEGAYLSLVGWLQPSGVWRVDGAGGVADSGLTPKPPIDLAPYGSHRAFAVARDGTRIPYTMIYHTGMRADGSNPALVTAYGAYESSATPRFLPSLLPFLDAGGIYVNANVRGGGEYGREWHKAGQKATKPNSWRDLIDVCETLVRDRVTSPTHLAITGTSAGGITVGRALTERPDLFAAAISNVGWSNPIRYSAEQNVSDIDEWGPITDAESFRIMYAMDSYQAVRDGTRYPAVLCVTGATDPRVAPWHVAKFAARLQAASTSGKPVLLRVDFDAGHGIGSTRSQADALAADMYAFVLWQTDSRGFQRN